MPSSYSTTLGIELMVTGEKSGTWGDITNTNLNIVEQSQGYVNKSIAGGAQTTALLINDGSTASSDARNLIIELSGTITGNQIVTVPDGIEKSYIVYNNTSGAFTVEFKTASGTGSTFSTTDKGVKILWSNGTNIVDATTLLATFGNLTTGTITSGDITSGAIAATGHITPGANDTYDLGASGNVWRNLYTGDLHLSNQAKNEGNIVDGTKGSWTLQEGKDDIFLINNNSNEKFKIKLEKVQGDL
jgi:hypothetical protein